MVVYLGDSTANLFAGGIDADMVFGFGGNDILGGGAGNDRLDGGIGDDVLDGGAGDDWLEGSSGNDSFSGGAGVDTVSYLNDPQGSAVITIGMTGTGGTAEGDFIAADVENLVGSQNFDSLGGSAGANYLYGAEGGDYLSGNGGDDRLDGGVGGDVLFGGDGIDTAIYFDSTAGVSVRINATSSLGWASGDIVLDDVENIEGSNGFGDTISGWSTANRLTGWGGDDSLSGLDGNDTLAGGAGADHLDGGAGIDIASYAEATTGVAVNLGAGTGAGSIAQGDTLVSIESVHGGAGNDSLAGSGGADVLLGNAGNDVLMGAGGRDALAGGAGVDRFTYGSAAQSPVGASDQITDFSHAQGDRIDLVSIDANSVVAGNQVFSFIGTAAFGHVTGQLRAETVAGVTSVYGDINGDGTADFQIRCAGAITLVPADFAL